LLLTRLVAQADNAFQLKEGPTDRSPSAASVRGTGRQRNGCLRPAPVATRQWLCVPHTLHEATSSGNPCVDCASEFGEPEVFPRIAADTGVALTDRTSPRQRLTGCQPVRSPSRRRASSRRSAWPRGRRPRRRADERRRLRRRTSRSRRRSRGGRRGGRYSFRTHPRAAPPPRRRSEQRLLS
jgi:hypothetical protein